MGGRIGRDGAQRRERQALERDERRPGGTPPGQGLRFHPARLPDVRHPPGREAGRRNPNPRARRGRETTEGAPERPRTSPRTRTPPEPDAADFADEEPAAADDEDALDAEPEEIPVFLTRKGKLLVFRDPESLVAYVKDNDDHDLAAIEEYAELQDRLDADDIVCDEDDIYELDLVVANLRGGQEAWEPELLIKAAEVGRDLGYALKNDSTAVGSLAPGSPLDDLDETFRVVVDGGLRGKLASDA